MSTWLNCIHIHLLTHTSMYVYNSSPRNIPNNTGTQIKYRIEDTLPVNFKPKWRERERERERKRKEIMIKSKTSKCKTKVGKNSTKYVSRNKRDNAQELGFNSLQEPEETRGRR